MSKFDGGRVWRRGFGSRVTAEREERGKGEIGKWGRGKERGETKKWNKEKR